MLVVGRLDDLDLNLKLSREQETLQLAAAQTRLLQLRLTLGGLVGDQGIGPPLLVVFEAGTRPARAGRSSGSSHPSTRVTCA